MINTINKTNVKKIDIEKYLQIGISYKEYKQNMAADLALNPDFKIKEYINLNQRRMHRVEKTYVPSVAVREQIKNLKHKVYWLVITEHWCGDASQTLPLLSFLAEMGQEKIELRLVYRDQNDELMNVFLTKGSRSIPKLIQLDENGNVTGIWGPRPTVAQELVEELKANPSTALTYASELHLWYAKDKQRSLETEILNLLLTANLFCHDCLS